MMRASTDRKSLANFVIARLAGADYDVRQEFQMMFIPKRFAAVMNNVARHLVGIAVDL